MFIRRKDRNAVFDGMEGYKNNPLILEIDAPKQKGYNDINLNLFWVT